MITIEEWIEDFDNDDVNEDERIELMMESVQVYNSQYQTNYNPKKEVNRYLMNSKFKQLM